MGKNVKVQDHSSAWIFQVWLSFLIAISAMTLGIICLPVNNWTKGFMGMGLVFTVGSTLNLAKTTRDLHEANKLISRVDEARLEKILNEHSPLS
jgi:hypothetical protein